MYKCFNAEMFECTNVRGHYGRGRHAVLEKGDAKARKMLATLKHLPCFVQIYFVFVFVFLDLTLYRYFHMYLHLLEK